MMLPRLWTALIALRTRMTHPDDPAPRRSPMWDVYEEDPPLTWRDWFTLPTEVLFLCIFRGIEFLLSPRRIIPMMIAVLVVSIGVIWIVSPSEVGAAP